MQSKNKRRLAWLALPLTIGLLAAACGGDDDEASTDEGDGTQTETVQVSGSSTVAPISTLVGEEFMASTEDAEVVVEGPGTGDGFELFCDGQTDISDASRPIDEEEIAACEANGIDYVELKVAFDGLTVMTNPNNSAVECLSFADLYALIGPEATGKSKWSDSQALAAELGSTTTFPDASLDLTGPGEESGTYDSFIELALADIAEERGQPDDVTRSDYDASPDDNVIVSGIETSDTSLGWVGFAYAEEAGDSIKELGVSAEPDGECVTPSAETIADDSYPLSRSLYIYVNTAKAESNPHVAEYVDFYLSDLPTWVEESGYVPMPTEQSDETLAAWEGR